jgi:hypothetical protein
MASPTPASRLVDRPSTRPPISSIRFCVSHAGSWSSSEKRFWRCQGFRFAASTAACHIVLSHAKRPGLLSAPSSAPSAYITSPSVFTGATAIPP